MRKTLVAAMAATCIMSQAQNPFFEEFKGTPHGTTPFDRISVADYEPAIDRGIKLGLEGVEKIVANPEAPTFENTVVALERSGKDLARVLNVFFPLLSSLSDDAMMELSMKITPRLSDYSTTISLNEGLWKRIKTVHDSGDTLRLSPEDKMLLKRTYESFTRNGAHLRDMADSRRPRRPSRKFDRGCRPRRQGERPRRRVSLHPRPACLHGFHEIQLSPRPPRKDVPPLHRPQLQG